jgi:hypothetical protein
MPFDNPEYCPAQRELARQLKDERAKQYSVKSQPTMIILRNRQRNDMPRGPRGEKRPADVIGRAIMVAKIATGEMEESRGKAPKRARGGIKGGKARARSLSAHERSEIARAAAAARWKKG